MNSWSLPTLLAGLHRDIQQKLATVREAIAHPGAKGNSSERVWLELLETYLPRRYRARSAFVVDSNGNSSDQIDVVIFDRQYTPFIFSFQDTLVVPAESVYAVFEAKQEINADQVAYAKAKAKSVRELMRTSLPIPSAGGLLPAKPPGRILAGLLTLDSGWSPPLGSPLERALADDDEEKRLELGCVAAHGLFDNRAGEAVRLIETSKPATAFLFELIARLQEMATVPMIDVRAYAEWLDVDLDDPSAAA
jgi:hypothetical protein